MTANNSTMKMPELLVFFRVFIIGLIGAEVFRAAYYVGLSFTSSISDVPDGAKIGGIIFIILLCAIYAKERGAFFSVKKLSRSLRIDLLITVGIGVWTNELVSPSLNQLHDILKNSDPQLAPAFLVMFCVVFLSPLAQKYWPRKKPDTPQLRFLTDDEIKVEKDNLYANGKQAKFFAETVLTSDAHPGLVFGLDGPWGGRENKLYQSCRNPLEWCERQGHCLQI